MQACVPSNHVCSYLVSPGDPHLSNQDPPGAQQVSLPDFLSTPHFLQALGSCVPGFIGSEYSNKRKVKEHLNASISHFRDSHGLTFALAHPLSPRMLKFFVARISTLPEPSTAPKATTFFAFSVGPTFRAQAPFSYRLRNTRGKHTRWRSSRLGRL